MSFAWNRVRRRVSSRRALIARYWVCLTHGHSASYAATPVSLLKRGPHRRRAREGRARGHVQLPHGLQAARRLAREAVADGLALAPQQLRPVPAGWGLPTGEEGAPLPPGLRATSMFVRQALLEGCHLVANNR